MLLKVPVHLPASAHHPPLPPHHHRRILKFTLAGCLCVLLFFDNYYPFDSTHTISNETEKCQTIKPKQRKKDRKGQDDPKRLILLLLWTFFVYFVSDKRKQTPCASKFDGNERERDNEKVVREPTAAAALPLWHRNNTCDNERTSERANYTQFNYVSNGCTKTITLQWWWRRRCAVRVRNFCGFPMEISRKVCWFFFFIFVCSCVEGSNRGVDECDWKFCWFLLPGKVCEQYTRYWWPVCFVGVYTRAQTVHIRLNSHTPKRERGALWLRLFHHVKGTVAFFSYCKVLLMLWALIYASTMVKLYSRNEMINPVYSLLNLFVKK